MLNICTDRIFIGRFILAPEFQWLIRRFGKDTLRAIHDSLNIKDRVAAFIRAERIKQYPSGIGLLSNVPVYSKHMLS